MSPTDRLARSLLLYAARSAPPALSERLAEEWLADLEARRAGFARLRHALGCCWATSIIAREHASVAVAAAAPAAGGVATHYALPDSPLLSRRALALALIACLHVGIIWAFANGLLQRFIDPKPPRTEATMLPDAPRPPVPAIPNPKLEPTVLHVPAVVDWFPPPPTGVDVVEATSAEPPVTTTAARGTVPSVQRVTGGPGRGFPNTEDFYPAPAIRANEQGSAAVNVCVNEGGRLTGDPTIAQSSGSPRLDAGALRLARAGSGHYQPTTEDGRAVSSCYSFRIRFTLPQ